MLPARTKSKKSAQQLGKFSNFSREVIYLDTEFVLEYLEYLFRCYRKKKRAEMSCYWFLFPKLSENVCSAVVKIVSNQNMKERWHKDKGLLDQTLSHPNLLQKDVCKRKCQ